MEAKIYSCIAFLCLKFHFVWALGFIIFVMLLTFMSLCTRIKECQNDLPKSNGFRLLFSLAIRICSWDGLAGFFLLRFYNYDDPFTHGIA